jgi:hypothetical protein
MARFSTVFGLTNTQAELDFIDIDLSSDNPFYVDPYAIQIYSDEWSGSCGDLIRSFFNEVLNALRAGDNSSASHLLNHLHEPNETHLGQSSGAPRGRGVGAGKAADLSKALVRSRAFETGVLQDISEAELFIEGVGPDTISDLTTNVIRSRLAEYTADQSKPYNVETRLTGAVGSIWDPGRLNWVGQQVQLPFYANRPVLLVPKFSVRHRLSINSQEFWNYHMIEFLRQEYLNSASGLVQMLRDGTPYVTKKSVKERHPLIKDELAEFVRKHPDILEAYKRLKAAQGAPSSEDIEENFDERTFARALSNRLRQIAIGSATATEYHRIISGVLTFLFYPDLIYPILEKEIHEGRKRIDLKFTNAAKGVFFCRSSNPIRPVQLVFSLNVRTILRTLLIRNLTSYVVDLGIRGGFLV